MKKEQIIWVRVLSVGVLLAGMALLLIFGTRSGLYAGIVQNINHNVIDISQAGASIYNLYFYQGLGVVYQGLFSVAFFCASAAAVGVAARFRGTAALAKTACVSGLAVGLYVLLTRIFEKSQGLHRLIAGFYMDGVDGWIEPAQLIGNWPVAAGVLLGLFSVICLLLIRSSRMSQLSVYQQGKVGSFGLLLPVVYGSLFLEMIREMLIGGRMAAQGQTALQAYTYVRDYYFADAWGLNLPYVWFVLVTALTGILLGRRFVNRRWLCLLPAGCIGLLLAVRSGIFLARPPRLFGYLTFDEAVCDATEAAYPMYLLLLVLDLLLLVFWTASLIQGRLTAKKILLPAGVHAAGSIIAVFAASAAGLAAVYGVCAAVNGVALIGSLYMADIRGRHH